MWLQYIHRFVKIFIAVKFSVPIKSVCLFLTPNPWQLLIFVCLWICLFWTFHVNGAIQYVAFFVCFTTFPKVMSSNCICVVACTGTVSFVAEYCHIDILYLSLLVLLVVDTCVLSALHIMNTTTMNALCTCFHFSYV